MRAHRRWVPNNAAMKLLSLAVLLPRGLREVAAEPRSLREIGLDESRLHLFAGAVGLPRPGEITAEPRSLREIVLDDSNLHLFAGAVELPRRPGEITAEPRSLREIGLDESNLHLFAGAVELPRRSGDITAEPRSLREIGLEGSNVHLFAGAADKKEPAPDIILHEESHRWDLPDKHKQHSSVATTATSILAPTTTTVGDIMLPSDGSDHWLEEESDHKDPVRVEKLARTMERFQHFRDAVMTSTLSWGVAGYAAHCVKRACMRKDSTGRWSRDTQCCGNAKDTACQSGHVHSLIKFDSWSRPDGFSSCDSASSQGSTCCTPIHLSALLISSLKNAANASRSVATSEVGDVRREDRKLQAFQAGPGASLQIVAGQGCSTYTSEQNCIRSADGSQVAYSSPCQWCCGHACTTNNNRCEPLDWLKHRSDYIGYSKNGYGVNTCQTCIDDPNRRRSGHPCSTFMGRRRSPTYCTYAPASRRRSWGAEARSTCKASCGICNGFQAPTSAVGLYSRHGGASHFLKLCGASAPLQIGTAPSISGYCEHIYFDSSSADGTYGIYSVGIDTVRSYLRVDGSGHVHAATSPASWSSRFVPEPRFGGAFSFYAIDTSFNVYYLVLSPSGASSAMSDGRSLAESIFIISANASITTTTTNATSATSTSITTTNITSTVTTISTRSTTMNGLTLCVPHYPKCYQDGDCVISSCQNGCSGWTRAPNPTTLPSSGGYNYIHGYDNNGARCTGDYQAMFIKGVSGTSGCPIGYGHIFSATLCQQASLALGFGYFGVYTESDWLGACSHSLNNNKGSFSSNSPQFTVGQGSPICQATTTTTSNTTTDTSTTIRASPLTQAGAAHYCAQLGSSWSVKYIDAQGGSLYCLLGATGTGDNCNDCTTYRIVVWKDGGGETRHDQSSYPFNTKAGNVYSAHTNPCATGPNTLGSPCDNFGSIAQPQPITTIQATSTNTTTTTSTATTTTTTVGIIDVGAVLSATFPTTAVSEPEYKRMATALRRGYRDGVHAVNQRRITVRGAQYRFRLLEQDDDEGTNANVVGSTWWKSGLKEEIFDQYPYSGLQYLNRTADLVRTASVVNFPFASAWPALQHVTFAMRWSGFLRIKTAGMYEFSIESDDGSRMHLNSSVVINNDGMHGLLKKSTDTSMPSGHHALKLEFFGRQGDAVMIFRYKGPDTGNFEVVVPRTVLKEMVTSSVKFLLGPAERASQNVHQQVAQAASSSNLIMLAPALPTYFNTQPFLKYTFGLLSPYNQQMLESIFVALQSAGVKSVVTLNISSHSSNLNSVLMPAHDLCAYVPTLSAAHGMAVDSRSSIMPDASGLDAWIAQLQTGGQIPHALISCTMGNICYTVVQKLKSANVNFRNLVFPYCMGDHAMAKETDLLNSADGRFVTGSSVIDYTSNVHSSVTHYTPAMYNFQYKVVYHEDPPALAAYAFAAVELLAFSIEQAGSHATDNVSAALRALPSSLTTLVGKVSFDTQGFNTRAWRGVQFQSSGASYSDISRTGLLRVPPWSFRQCTVKSVGEHYGFGLDAIGQCVQCLSQPFLRIWALHGYTTSLPAWLCTNVVIKLNGQISGNVRTDAPFSLTVEASGAGMIFTPDDRARLVDSSLPCPGAALMRNAKGAALVGPDTRYDSGSSTYLTWGNLSAARGSSVRVCLCLLSSNATAGNRRRLSSQSSYYKRCEFDSDFSFNAGVFTIQGPKRVVDPVRKSFGYSELRPAYSNTFSAMLLGYGLKGTDQGLVIDRNTQCGANAATMVPVHTGVVTSTLGWSTIRVGPMSVAPNRRVTQAPLHFSEDLALSLTFTLQTLPSSSPAAFFISRRSGTSSSTGVIFALYVDSGSLRFSVDEEGGCKPGCSVTCNIGLSTGQAKEMIVELRSPPDASSVWHRTGTAAAWSQACTQQLTHTRLPVGHVDIFAAEGGATAAGTLSNIRYYDYFLLPNRVLSPALYAAEGTTGSMSTLTYRKLNLYDPPKTSNSYKFCSCASDGFRQHTRLLGVTTTTSTVPPVSVVGGLSYSMTSAPVPGHPGRTWKPWVIGCTVTWLPPASTTQGVSTYRVFGSANVQMAQSTLLATQSMGTNSIEITSSLGGCPNYMYVGVYTNTGTLVGVTQMMQVSNFPKLPQVNDVRLHDTDMRQNFIGGNVTWINPCIAPGLVLWYTAWLSTDSLGFHRVQFLGNVSAQETVLHLDPQGVPTNGGQYVIVYAGNLAGEFAVGESIALQDAFSGSGGRRLLHDEHRELSSTGSNAVTLMGGYDYTEAASNYTSFGLTKVRHPWAYYFSVAWNGQPVSQAYNIYSSSDSTMGTKTLLTSAPAAHSNGQSYVSFSGALTNRIHRDHKYIGVFTPSGQNLGAAPIRNLQLNFAKMPLVSNVGLVDTDMRSGHLAGQIRWAPPTTGISRVTSYSVWLTADRAGFNRVKRITSSVPVGTNDLALPSSGVPIAYTGAKYVMVLTNNLAGEQAVGRTLKFFDRTPFTGVCATAATPVTLFWACGNGTSNTHYGPASAVVNHRSMIIIWESRTGTTDYRIYSADTPAMGNPNTLGTVPVGTNVLEVPAGSFGYSSYIGVFTSTGTSIGTMGAHQAQDVVATNVQFQDVDPRFGQLEGNLTWQEASLMGFAMASYTAWFVKDAAGYDRNYMIPGCEQVRSRCVLFGQVLTADDRYIAVYARNAAGQYSIPVTIAIEDVYYTSGCETVDDYKSEAGVFFVGTWATISLIPAEPSMSQAQVKSGVNFNISVSSSEMTRYDRILLERMPDASHACPAGIPTGDHAGTGAGLLIDAGAMPPIIQSSTSGFTFTWPSLVQYRPGHLHVCLCTPEATIGCTQYGEYSYSAGSISIGGPQSVQVSGVAANNLPVTAALPPKVAFNIEISGIALTASDSVQVIQRSERCGLVNPVHSGYVLEQPVSSYSKSLSNAGTLTLNAVKLAQRTHGSFRVCWCSGQVTCSHASDYRAQAGVFALGGWNLQLRNPVTLGSLAVMAYMPFELEVKGSYLLTSDRISIIAWDAACGTVAAKPSIAGLSYIPERSACKQRAWEDLSPTFIENFGSAAASDCEYSCISLFWRNLRVTHSGKFKVCWCGLVEGACDDGEAFSETVGFMRVANVTALQVIGSETRSPADVREREAFDINVGVEWSGNEDRIRIVDTSVTTCGYGYAAVGTADGLAFPNLDRNDPGCTSDLATFEQFRTHIANYIVDVHPGFTVSVQPDAPNSGQPAGMNMALQNSSGYAQEFGSSSCSASVTFECERDAHAVNDTVVSITATSSCAWTMVVRLRNLCCVRQTFKGRLWQNVVARQGSYSICWCGGSSCNVAADFSVDLGAFRVQPAAQNFTSWRLSNGIVDGPMVMALGADFAVAISGNYVLPSDQIRIVESVVDCSSPSARQSSQFVAREGQTNGSACVYGGGLDDNMPTYQIVGHRASVSWDVSMAKEGHYRVCFCGLLWPRCDSHAGFGQSIGTIVVTRLDAVTVRTVNNKPNVSELEAFIIRIRGSHLSSSDRISIVPTTVICGLTGANETDTNGFPGFSQYSSGQQVTLSTGTGQIRDHSNIFSRPGNYTVCWCGGFGNACLGHAELYSVSLGHFTVAESTHNWVLNGLTGTGPLVVAVGQVFTLEIATTNSNLISNAQIHIVAIGDVCNPQIGSNANVLLDCSSHAGTNCASSASRVFKGPPDATPWPRNFPRWSGVMVTQAGEYKVCFDGIRVGKFSVSSIQGMLLHRVVNNELKMYVPFDLQIVGNHLSIYDRISVMRSSKMCGDAGSHITQQGLVDNLAASTPGTLSQGNPGVQWNNLVMNDVGYFRVCWCGGLGNLCNQPSAFTVSVGLFHLSSAACVWDQLSNQALGCLYSRTSACSTIVTYGGPLFAKAAGPVTLGVGENLTISGGSECAGSSCMYLTGTHTLFNGDGQWLRHGNYNIEWSSPGVMVGGGVGPWRLCFYKTMSLTDEVCEADHTNLLTPQYTFPTVNPAAAVRCCSQGSPPPPANSTASCSNLSAALSVATIADKAFAGVTYRITPGSNVVSIQGGVSVSFGNYLFDDYGAQYFSGGAACTTGGSQRSAIVAFRCGSATQIVSAEVDGCLSRFVVEVAGLCCSCLSPGMAGTSLVRTVPYLFGVRMTMKPGFKVEPDAATNMFSIPTMYFDIQETHNQITSSYPAMGLQVFMEQSSQGSCDMGASKQRYRVNVAFTCGAVDTLVEIPPAATANQCHISFQATYREFCCPGSTVKHPDTRQQCNVPSSKTATDLTTPETAQNLCAASGMQVCTAEQLSSGICCATATPTDPRAWTSTMLTGCPNGTNTGLGLLVKTISWTALPGDSVSSFTFTFRTLPDGSTVPPRTYGTARAGDTTTSVDFVEGEFITYVAAEVGCSGIACGLSMQTSINRNTQSLSLGMAITPNSFATIYRATLNTGITGFVLSLGEINDVIRIPICYSDCPDPQVMQPLRDAIATYTCPTGTFRHGMVCSITCPYGYQLLGATVGSVTCEYGNLVTQGGATCLSRNSCTPLPLSADYTRTYDFVSHGHTSPHNPDPTLAPFAEYKISCKAPRLPWVSTYPEERLVCNHGSWNNTNGGTAAFRNVNVDALPQVNYPGVLTCTDLKCPMTDLSSAATQAQGTLNCATSGSPAALGTECQISCPVGDEMSVNFLYRCVYVTQQQRSAIQSAGTVAASVNLTSYTSLPSDAVATFAPMLPDKVTMQYAKGLCILITCATPNVQGGLPVWVNGAVFQAGTATTMEARLDCTGMRYQNTCVPVCQYGHQIVTGKALMTCEANRVFSGSVQCEPIPCTSIPTGLALPATLEPGCNTGKVHTNKCQINCPTGQGNTYLNVGQDHFLCDAGTWTRVNTGGSLSQCTPSPCTTAPQVLFGGDMSSCANKPHGYVCPTVCKTGYVLAGTIICTAGAWDIPGNCVAQAAQGANVPAVTSKAVQVDLDVSSTGAAAGMDYSWAVSNAATISQAVALSLGISSSNLRIDIMPLTGSAGALIRRLSPGGHTASSSSGTGGSPSPSPSPSTSPTTTSTTITVTGSAVVSPNGFTIRVVMLIAPTADSNAAKAQLQQKLYTVSPAPAPPPGSPTPAPGSPTPAPTSGMTIFQSTLVQTLQQQGQAVPPGLTTATINAVAPPQYIEEYTTTSNLWVPLPWGQCSTSCGVGIKKRDTLCPTGVGTCGNAKPSEEDSCSDYDGCPFDIMCPFGKGKSPGCGAQLGICLGIIGGIVLILILRGCYKFYRKMQPAREGRQFFNEIQKAAQFKVYRPHSKEPVAREVVKDGKTHVVWEIDQQFVEAWFQERRDIDGDGIPDPIAQEPDLIHQLAPDNQEAVEDEDSDSDDSEDIVPEQPLDWTGNYVPIPQYEDGERVEYFSDTHRQWILGIVRIRVVDGDEENYLDPIVMYDVEMMGATRKNVTLDRVRRLFVHGDLIELFSKRDNGTWLAGMIAGQQTSGATLTGYQVHLDDYNRVFEDIPTIRLRRRFPADQPIRVYRGPRDGWQNLIVHHSATENGVGLEQILLDGDYQTMADQLALPRAQSASSSKREETEEDEEELENAGPNVLDQGLWTQVPVDISPDDANDDFIYVPSFLIQHRSAQDHNRRQVIL